MARWLAAASLAACQGPEPIDTVPTDARPETGDTSVAPTHTGSVPDASVAATCAPQPDNALRVDCDVEVSPPGPVAITVSPGRGGEPRTTTSSAVAERHRVTIWRLYADTEVPFTVTATDTGATSSGTFRTGALEEGVQPVVTLAGDTTATEDTLVMIGCGRPRAVVVDREGRVVWYQDLALGLPDETTAHAVTFTTEGDVAAIVANDRVRRFDLDGTMTLDAAVGTTPGFDKLVHHDLFARDGYLWVLNAAVTESDGQSYVLDGLYVFDRSGAIVDEWALADRYVPTEPPIEISNYWSQEFPGAYDASHGNGLYVDERLDVTLSFHLPSALVRLHGDPAAPDFGAPVWTLDTSGPWPSDFTVVDPDQVTADDTFERQHHPLPLPGGELRMFDNELSGQSRVLSLRLDEAEGEAVVTGSWPIGAYCPIGGSAFDLGNGNLLATCSTSATVSEIEPASGTIVRTMSLACATGPSILIPRGIPVTL